MKPRVALDSCSRPRRPRRVRRHRAGDTTPGSDRIRLVAIGNFANGIDATAKTDIDPGNATDLWRIRISAKGATDVHVLENIIAPGGSFGWHSHPGPSLVTVKSGTLSIYQAPDCTPEDFGPGSPNGSTFVDQGHDLHMVRNNSTTVIADVYVVSFVPAGFGRRIDEPNPNPSTCPN